MKVDFLIIGQGLSGTVLAQTIESKSLSYHLIDKNERITSSKVAAGIMQPISFKRCIINWRGEEFYNYSNSFYKKSESISNKKVYKKIKLIRLFSSFEEQNNWLGKSSDPIYSSILGTKNTNIKSIKNNFGNSEVKKCSQLNVKEYLKGAKDYFFDKGNLTIGDFDENILTFDGDFFSYNGIKSKYIIFCQGVNNLKNKLFDYLPIIPNKGELLDISTEDLPNLMLSKGCFTIPIGKNKFRLGSTYDHKDNTKKSSIKAKNQLISKFKKISPECDFEITDHKFGFRPTTIDRKPIVGAHPKIKNMFIFNGLGSKGVLMAPLLSKELLDHILRKSKINSNIDVNRFFNRYSIKHNYYAQNLFKF